MLVEQRRSRLLELVRTGRFASLPQLAETLDVSESTVRRDVEYLEIQGCCPANPWRRTLYWHLTHAAQF